MNYGIGKLIKDQRAKRGWDQAELTRRIGGAVRQQAVSGWERGASRPKRSTIARLAEVFEMNQQELLTAAGYITATVDAPHQIPRAVRPRVTVLPLAELSADRFEEFSADLAQQLYPDAHVTRYGSQGHTQHGFDVVAQKGKVYEAAFQCKRHKQFGPANVITAVSEAQLEAKHFVLLLTRVASPDTRDEIKKHSKWEIWDIEDMSRKVRNLHTEDALRLIDTYFPGWREPFLGIAEPGPWQTPQDFFRRFTGDQIFSHSWKFVGRLDLLKEVEGFLEDDKPVAIISGRGGSGKTRLLRQAAELAENKFSYKVRFLELGKDVKPESYETLPREPHLLIVIDDAHERSDIAEIMSGVTRVNPSAKFLLAIRPYGFSQLAYDLRRVAIHPTELPHWELQELQGSEAEALVREIIGPNLDFAIVQRLARITRDCPLVMVVGAGLVKRGRLDPNLLESDEEIQDQILRAFRDALLVNPGKGEPRIMNALLNAVAIMQPVVMKDQAFVEALEKLTGASYDELLPYIRSLEDAAVFVRRGNALRIVPDLLGDVILAEACFDERSGTGTGYIARAQRQLDGAPLQHILVNATRVDWQVTRKQGGAPSLVDSLWTSIETEFRGAGLRGRQQLMKLIQKVAYFQPSRALALAKWAIENPTERLEDADDMLSKIYPPSYNDILREVPQMLKYIAYNLDFLPEAADLLWELSKTDYRRTNQYPEHPIRMLGDLADYQIGKPLEFNKQIIDAAERWLKDENVGDLAYSPFDVLEHLMATEGSDDFSEGLTISFRPYPINAQAVKALRDRVLALAIKEAKSSDVKRATRAIDAIADSLRYPAGLFGRIVGEDERNAWTPIFVETINQLKDIAADKNLDPVIGIALQKALQWHRRYSKTATKAAAKEVLDSIPVTINHQLAMALYDGWGHIFFERMKDYNAAQERQQKWFEAIVAKLMKTRSPKKVVDLLIERLEAQTRAFDFNGSPTQFAWSLVKDHPDIANEVFQRALTDPDTVLLRILPLTLSIMSDKEPDKTLQVANRMMKIGNLNLTRAVNQAFSWSRNSQRPLIDGEMDLLLKLAGNEDENIRHSLVRAAQVIAKESPDAAAELVSTIKFSDSAAVAEEIFSSFGEPWDLKWSSLSQEQAGKMWSQLRICPEISSYQMEEFLAKYSRENPQDILKLLKARIEYAEDHEDDHAYRAVPLGWHIPLQIRDHAQFAQILREIRDWIAAKPDSWRRHKLGSEVFKAAAGHFDETVIKVIDEALRTGSKDQVDAVASILHEAPRTLVWENVDFVRRALHMASKHGEKTLRHISSALHSAVISGSRSGTPGQPFSEDIEQRDKSAAIAKMLPAGSLEAKFYASLEKSAINSINWRAEDDERLMDGRDWEVL